MIAETYVELLQNWPHWAFELTVEAVTFVLGTIPARIILKRHDAKKHGNQQCDPHCEGDQLDVTEIDPPYNWESWDEWIDEGLE